MDKLEKKQILLAEKAKHDEFVKKQKEEKEKIKAQPKHFWKLVLHYVKQPFLWCKNNLTDWKTWLIFVIWVLIVGCTVWIPYGLSIFPFSAEFKEWCIGIATGSLVFWNVVPCTPFLLICGCLTTLTKTLFNKFRLKKIEKEEQNK